MNETCDLCHSQSPTAVCLCQFPLLKTCGTCQSKHSEIATGQGFHYSLPLTALAVITTKGEWVRRSRDIPQTLVAQGVLNVSLQELDQLESSVKAAYLTQEATLHRLRDKYLEAIKKMKTRAQEEFSEVIIESQAHLLDINFASMHPTREWLDYFKNPSAADVELFGGAVEAGNEEALQSVFKFQLWTQLRNLSDYAYSSVQEIQTGLGSELAAGNAQLQVESALTIQHYESDIEALTREKEDLAGEMQGKTTEIKQLNEQIEELNRLFVKAVSDNNDLVKQLEAAENLINRLKTERRGLEAKIGNEQFQVDERRFAQTTLAADLKRELIPRIVLRRLPRNPGK
jgi:hypothetical protein